MSTVHGGGGGGGGWDGGDDDRGDGEAGSDGGGSLKNSPHSTRSQPPSAAVSSPIHALRQIDEEAQGEQQQEQQQQQQYQQVGGGASVSASASVNSVASSSAPSSHHYSNVHNLPNAKRMRKMTATSSDASSTSAGETGGDGTGGDSGGNGSDTNSLSGSTGTNDLDSPRLSSTDPQVSPRMSSLSSRHHHNRNHPAVFSPPTGLEKRFEEVLRLEDKATSVYRMGQKIKMAKNKKSKTATMTATEGAGATEGAASTATPNDSMSDGCDSDQQHDHMKATSVGSASVGSRDSPSSYSTPIGARKSAVAAATAAALPSAPGYASDAAASTATGEGTNASNETEYDDDEEADDDDDDGQQLGHGDSADALLVPDVTQEELEKLLYAKDMYEMSAAEREYVLQDIHGVATTPVQELDENNPEFVATKRRQLQQALLQSPTHGTAAYSRAVQTNYSYVTSPEFQLPFLRCNQWDVDAAAKQIIDHFDVRLQLFAPELLCRHRITLADLSKDDRKQLETGFFQFLPVRDVAGRAIICAFPPVERGPIKSLVRAFYYLMMTLIEDIETQRNGLILMGVNVGPKRRVDREVVFNVHKVRRALPLRTVGIHYCYDDIKMIPMMTLGMLAMGAAGRVRFRSHYGDWKKDISYQVATFGIPAHSVPITEDGEVKVKAIRSWVKSRMAQEETQQRQLSSRQTPQRIIVLPTRVDVLLGRGKPIQDHVGNLRYHALLEHYHVAYEDAKKFQKKQLAKNIVGIVHELGGRFLKQDAAGAGWVEVDDSVAWDKVSHAFRTMRTTVAAANMNAESTILQPSVSSSLSTSVSTTATNKRRNVMEERMFPDEASSNMYASDPQRPSANSDAGHVHHPPVLPSLLQQQLPIPSNTFVGGQISDQTAMSQETSHTWQFPINESSEAEIQHVGHDPEDHTGDDIGKASDPVKMWDNWTFHPL